MRATLVRAASPATITPTTGLRQQPLALLPPIPLYRRLFRAHRKFLGHEERVLGDMYIKSEFRAHRKVENPIHIVGFLSEWQMYAQALEGDSWRGEKFDKAKVDMMSDDQIGQLYELMQSIQKQTQNEEIQVEPADSTKPRD